MMPKLFFWINPFRIYHRQYIFGTFLLGSFLTKYIGTLLGALTMARDGLEVVANYYALCIGVYYATL